MVKKTVKNGELELHDTTKIQLRSLDDFACQLGYQRGVDNQYYSTFSGSTGVCSENYRISFNTMVYLHNTDHYRDPVDKNYTGVPVKLLNNLIFTKKHYEEALRWRSVAKVKIQRKKNTTLVVQDHQVKYLVSVV